MHFKKKHQGRRYGLRLIRLVWGWRSFVSTAQDSDLQTFLCYVVVVHDTIEREDLWRGGIFLCPLCFIRTKAGFLTFFPLPLSFRGFLSSLIEVGIRF